MAVLHRFYFTINLIVGACSSGQYWDKAIANCSLCAAGSFSDDPLSESCELCPTDMSTADTGAESQDLCVPGKAKQTSIC